MLSQRKFGKPHCHWAAAGWGMTPNGGILKERIVLNDITLWSRSPQDANYFYSIKS